MNAPNRSLREKSAARMAAAQLLYTVALTGEKIAPERMLKDYQHYIDGSKADPKEAGVPKIPPSMALLKKLLEGMAQHGEALEPLIDKTLTGDWKKERMSPLLLAILRLAAFELAHFPQTAPSIIVNEYVSLAGQFFGEQETGFVNAALNALAVELRT